MAGLLDAWVQSGIEEAILGLIECVEQVAGDAQRADCVPDADHLHIDLGERVLVGERLLGS